MRTIQYLIACLTLLSASILASSQAAAQCPNCPTDPQASCPTGVCPSEAPSSLSYGYTHGMAVYGGQPARNVARVAAIPVKVVVRFAGRAKELKPVRRTLKAVFRVATGRGPVLSRIRSCR